MEGAVALGLAILSIPFILPFVSWLMARKVRKRVIELEERVSEQDERISNLSHQLALLKKHGVAPAAPAAERPAAPVITTPVAPAPPPPVATPPVAVTPPVVVTPPVAVTPVTPPTIPAPAPPPLAPTPPPPPPRAAAPETPKAPAEASPPPPPREPIFEPPPSEPPAPAWSFDLEQLVGVRLFSAIAGIALVFAAVFFLRYSLDQGWLQPQVRVVIGILVAITLLVVCDRKAARKYVLLANAMDAAAIAILFATFFAAHSLWNLISATTAFGLLALVTLTAVTLAIRHESLFIAVLGLLGGFATPILLSTGENRPVPLFAYLLLLNVGLAWVVYRTGWLILSVLTLVLTTLYQWGWVARFLDAAQVPLAIGIFTIFPLVGYVLLLAARSRPGAGEHAGNERFEWMALVASLLPIAFALYLASSSSYRDHYALIFGWIFLIDAALLALAIAREEEILHAAGAATTVIAVSTWLSVAYLPGAVLPVVGFVALFVVFYLAAPAIADRFGEAFSDAGAHAILAAPILLMAFPLLLAQEPRTADPVVIFPALFVLVSVITWRAFAEDTGRLYFIAAFSALVAEASWSSQHLTAETLPQALAIYLAFAVLYLGVPQLARRRGAPLRPAAAPGVVLLFGLLLLIYFADARVATAGIWGLALLLAILNAALFIESASASLPLLALAGSVVSWGVLFVWWNEAAAVVGLHASLLVVVGLSLVMVGGYMWGLRYAAPAPADDAGPSLKAAANGLWLALLGHLFLLGVAANLAWAVPPWPLFGALAVVTLAFSTASLAARNAPIHVVSTVMTAAILLVWRGTTQAAGHADVAIGAFAVLALFALAWMAVARRYREMAAMTAAAVIVVSEISLIAMRVQPSPAPFAIALSAHVAGFAILLALATYYAWPFAATGFALLGGLAAASILVGGVASGRDVLIHAAAIYAVFAAYPLVLGSRARANRDPYVAALVAGAWCFLIARRGMTLAELEWMVGVVPVAIGAVTTVHLYQLLRLQPSGERDLGRLALVAGAALAFLTVAIPLQLEHQWITIGWALEGAAIAWLYTRIPHRGLLLFAVALMAAVFGRLAVNPEVFRYEPRGDLRILNWYLYTYLIAAATMGLAAWWLSKTEDRLLDNVPRPRHFLPVAAAILLFLLLNIEIADYYSTGPEILFRFGSSIQQDLTYTIAWLIFGIVMLAAGIIAKARLARMASVALIAVTTSKCFLYDLGSLGGLYRVGSLVGLAMSLALVALVLQKYVLPQEKETT